MNGKVTFVGAGPGDPELITLRGWRALQGADVILYDSLVERRLLDGLRARLLFVGKRCGRHSMPQEEINRLLAAQALKGRAVVRLKGGDGAVLGRLGEELLHLAAQGIPYEVVPGVTSATAAPVFAGIPVTHRGLADSFVVATAHRRQDDTEFSIPPYHPHTTVVLLMALGTTALWQAQLLRSGYPAALPLAFVSQGGTPQQRVLLTTVGRALADVGAAELATPALAVVGQVASLHARLAWYGPGQAAAPASGCALPGAPLSGAMAGGD